MSAESAQQSDGAILVRVSPTILEKLKTGDVEPVVMLGVDEQPDGTYDMTLQTPPVDPELVNHRKATARVYALIESNASIATGMVSVAALREAMEDRP